MAALITSVQHLERYHLVEDIAPGRFMFIVFAYLFSNPTRPIFGCTPVAKYWKPDEPGHCINVIKADYVYGSLNFITDLTMFVLPLPMVWRLQLSLKQKLGISLVFMAGSMYVLIWCT